VNFKSATDLRVSTSNSLGPYTVPGLVFDTRYEIIITPLVASAGSDYVESEQSLFGVGYVSTSPGDPLYPKVFTGAGLPNWASSFNWQSLSTAVAKNTAGQPFDAGDPTVSVTSVLSRRAAKPASGEQIRDYIELKFDKTGIANYVALHVYRREFSRNAGSTTTTEAKHNGVGRWERVIVSGGADTQTINLRMPTKFEEFNSLATAGTTTPIVKTPFISGYENTYVPVANNSNFTQLLLIVETTGGLSNKGVFVKCKTNNQNPGFTNMIDIVKPTIIEYATTQDIQDSDFLDGRFRKISEARTSLAFSNIMYAPFNSTIYFTTVGKYGYTLSGSYPTPVAGSAIV
jgi:hypothetical protein